MSEKPKITVIKYVIAPAEQARLDKWHQEFAKQHPILAAHLREKHRRQKMLADIRNWPEARLS